MTQHHPPTYPSLRQECIDYVITHGPKLDAGEALAYLDNQVDPVEWRPIQSHRKDWSRLCVRGSYATGYRVYVEFYDAELDSYDYAHLRLVTDKD